MAWPVCKEEFSAGRAIAILAAPRDAGPAPGGTGIRLVADPVAAVVHAGVRKIAVMRGGAETAVFAWTGAEFTNRAAIP
jgi:hypothetical protein